MKARINRAIVSGVLILTGLAWVPVFAQAAYFNVPSEDAGKSIPELGRQAGVQIIASGETLHGLVTPAIKGSYDVHLALEMMLKGTNLVVDHEDDGVITITARDKGCGEEEALTNVRMKAMRTVSLFALLFGAATTPACHAQATTADADTVETVVVTGSRVISSAANSPTPLTVLSTEDLQLTTPTNIPDALNKMPVFQGSLQPRSAGGAGSDASMNVLNLRNFGANRTLILLDGRRVTPANADGTVSADTLPQTLMSRVDVVTGGASAVYGSDAVTGVVNFILDKKFSGFKANINGGISTYGDGASFKVDLAAGTDLFGGHGHIEAALTHFQQDAVPMMARPYGPQTWAQTGSGTAANPFTMTEYATRPTAPFGGRVTCSSCSANGYVFASDSLLTPFVSGTATGTGNVESGGGGGYNKYGTNLTAQRNNNLFARFSYDLSSDTTFFVDATAGEQFSSGWWFPVKIGPGSTATFFKNNPFLSAAAQSQLGNNGLNDSSNQFSIGEFVDLGQEGNAGTRGVNRMLSFTTGLEGVVDGFDWNVFYTHGEARQAWNQLNNNNYQKQFAALDAVIGSNGTIQCYAATQAATAAEYAGCVPLNPFGPTSMTMAALKWMTDDTWYHMTNTLDNFGGSISGSVVDGWAGPIKAALSGEMRFNDMAVDSNASPTAKVDCTGLRICNSNQLLWAGGVLPMHASNNVWELAVETDIPLLKDLPFAKSLDVNLAGRYTDYSTSGSVETWKVGIDYHVNDQIRFRGTTSVDIRAPNLNELFQPATVAAGVGYADLHTGYNGTTQRIQSGNPNLVPEVARTYTFGVVLTPDFVQGLTTSLDYYQIRLHNAIGQITGESTSTQQLCEASGGTSSYCSLYVRPNAFSDHSTANYPTAVYTQVFNTALTEIQGFDFEANYGFEWNGSWAARLLANYQPVNESQAYPGAPFTYTQVLPNNDVLSKTHVTGTLTYSVKDWSVSLQDRWIAGYSRKTTSSPTIAQVYTNPHVHSVNYLDVNLQKDFEAGGIDFTGYFTVQNVFNAQGDIYSSYATQGLYYPVSPEDDVMGRYFTLGVRVKL